MSGEHVTTEESAHDVLAAEAFAVPGPDPVLHHRHIELPEDPSGIDGPHDVLAAEEFALPAAAPSSATRQAQSSWLRGVGAAVASVAGLLLLGRRRPR